MKQQNYKTITAALLAFAVAAPNAFAGTCDLTDGFEMAPAAFNTEAEACLEGANGIEHKSLTERSVRDMTVGVRTDEGMGELSNLASLNEAARLHAYDMAARGYADHLDKEGRSHMDRVRLLDRKRLLGAFGANVVVVDASSSPQEAFGAIMSDPNNAGNLTRDAFTHMGVGAAEANGNLYIVQLFARIDGALTAAVPISSNGKIDLGATYASESFKPVGWRIETASGETVERGVGRQITKLPASTEPSYLSIDVAYKNDVYTLRGPALPLASGG